MKSPLTAKTLPDLTCACANLRRAARAVTRLYNEELRETGLELTQHTLLMTLEQAGEITQKTLGRLLAMDSTTLTRSLKFLVEQGWLVVNPGADRREKLLRLTAGGRRKLQQARPVWEHAQTKLRAALGDKTWQQMGDVLTEVSSVAAEG